MKKYGIHLSETSITSRNLPSSENPTLVDRLLRKTTATAFNTIVQWRNGAPKIIGTLPLDGRRFSTIVEKLKSIYWEDNLLV